MMKNIKAVIILMLTVLLAGCANRTSNESYTPSADIQSEATSLSESLTSSGISFPDSTMSRSTSGDQTTVSSELSMPDAMNVAISSRETKDYHYRDDADQPVLVEMEEMLPTFSGGDDSVQKVKDDIDQLATELQENTSDAVKTYTKEVDSGASTDVQWLESLLSLITFDDGNYLNLRVISQRYEGGVHGGQMIYDYVFDKKQGKRLELSGIINNDEKSFEELLIKHFRADGYAEESDESPEAIAAERAMGDYSFYIADNGLHIHFNSNEIGSTSMGDPDILIPYNELDMKIPIGKGDQQYNAEDYYYDM